MIKEVGRYLPRLIIEDYPHGTARRSKCWSPGGAAVPRCSWAVAVASSPSRPLGFGFWRSLVEYLGTRACEEGGGREEGRSVVLSRDDSRVYMY